MPQIDVLQSCRILSSHRATVGTLVTADQDERSFLCPKRANEIRNHANQLPRNAISTKDNAFRLWPMSECVQISNATRAKLEVAFAIESAHISSA